MKKSACNELPQEANFISLNVSETAVCTNYCNNDVSWYLSYLSSYNKVVRMVTWMLRFIKNSRLASYSRYLGDIQTSEFENAEKLIFRLMQQESFRGVSDSRLKGLNVKLDEDGLIRTKTLVANRVDEFGFRYPIVLEPSHKFMWLLVEHIHKTAHHAGCNTVLRVLRERFWILRSRRTVRSIINKCVTCRRYTAKPLETETASLPLNRVKEASISEVIGIDYVGPVYLNNEKAWIYLFTCAVYRGVHFELVSTLSTEGFLQAFKRFIARRGRPKIVYSDNGSNFVGANRLFRAVNWEKIASHVSVEKIDWRFNPPTAAWWGGWWERLVRILKDLLKRTLKKALLSYEKMNTILCDCESIVNSRPITYMPDDKEGLLLALTPEMFLKDIREDNVPDIDHLEKISLNRRLRYRQRLHQELRMRFRSEYLGQLERRSTRSSRTSSIIKQGDLALIARDDKRRLHWPLARVIQVIPGNDGIPRVAKVKIAEGELIHSLQRLLLLEGESRSDKDNLITTSDVPQENLEVYGKQNVEQRALEDSHIVPSQTDSMQKESHVNLEKRTRSGRVSKPPKGFDV